MKKLIKWLLGSAAVLAALLILAVILLPVFFDPNDHKPKIQEIVSDSIGREVVLSGPIEWSVFPWIAINLSDVKIANEQGFKGDYLAEVKQVSARVKLWPLISKQIEIGQIILNQPTIKLQIAQSGHSNWQSLLSSGSESESTDTTDSQGLSIEGISVEQGHLNYVDATSDLALTMTNLRFNSDAIKPDTPTQMAVSAILSIPEQHLQGEIDSQWQATELLNQPVLNIKGLSFEGTIDKIPLTLIVNNNMVIDTNKDTLVIDELQLDYGALTLKTPVNGSDLSQNMKLSGQLKLDQFSLAQLLEQMGSPLNNQADNELSGSASWSLLNDRLQLTQLNMKLDESEIKGRIDLKQLSLLKGSFELDINHINLDQYLPQDETNTSAAANDKTESLHMGHISGQIKLKKLQVAGVQMSDISLNIKTNGSDLSVEPLQAGFYQGLIKTELQLSPNQSTEKLKVTHSMNDFQAGGLLTDLIGTEYLSGLGQLNADIKVDQPFSSRPLKSANGTVSYQINNGEIVGIDIYQIIEQGLSLLDKTDVIQNGDDLKTAFGLMDIQADINQGVLQTRRLQIKSPFFELTGQVAIDLDQQTIRGTIKPMLTNIPPDVINKNFVKLLNIRIPVTLKGQLLAPDISIDIEKLILESQKAKINEKKEELKQDLFDAILGSKKDKNQKPAADGESQPKLTEKQKKKAKEDQLKRDLLNSLLNSGKDKDKDDDNGN